MPIELTMYLKYKKSNATGSGLRRASGTFMQQGHF
jgi:hypothetical protein